MAKRVCIQNSEVGLKWDRAQDAVHVLTVIGIAAFIVTGLGISDSRLVFQLTNGLLDKATSFEIHSALLWPFIIVLVLHIFFAMRSRFKRRWRGWLGE